MMSEVPGDKEGTGEVSVAELERYLTGLAYTFKEGSSIAILKICFSRLREQSNDAKTILNEMLHFFEETQPDDIAQNEIYLELLNLYLRLFPGEVASPPHNLRSPFSAHGIRAIPADTMPPAEQTRSEAMKPTVKPPEFIGGAMNPYARIKSSEERERSEAITMRPSFDPDSDRRDTDEQDDEAEDTHSRATMPDIDRKELAVMLEMLAKEKRLRKIFALDDDAAGAEPAAKAEPAAGPAPDAGTESVRDGSDLPLIETGETDLEDLGLPEEGDPR